MKTVKEFRVEAKMGGVWETCGYRETAEEADSYIESLKGSEWGSIYEAFRKVSTMTKYEESEQYLNSINQ